MKWLVNKINPLSEDEIIIGHKYYIFRRDLAKAQTCECIGFDSRRIEIASDGYRSYNQFLVESDKLFRTKEELINALFIMCEDAEPITRGFRGIRVIEHGNQYHGTKMFSCSICNCKFEADYMVYKHTTAELDDIPQQQFICECPECGSKVYNKPE